MAAIFRCPILVENEIGDLIEAFNRMVASIAEQRAGLNDTLSLLDSMLANAPIGLAFFDRRLPLCAREPGVCRYDRRFALDATWVAPCRSCCRQPAAQELEDAVLRVFAQQRSRCATSN